MEKNQRLMLKNMKRRRTRRLQSTADTTKKPSKPLNRYGTQKFDKTFLSARDEGIEDHDIETINDVSQLGYHQMLTIFGGLAGLRSLADLPEDAELDFRSQRHHR